ncbi:multicopper oxidase family protein [Pseudarthrobacter sp. B907]|uniref:multicopper oxidase family protein n=1 Tax=Pseudarthrobacter sp. B907 TaxID=3158261 RepID=UPI0032DA6EB2
MHLEDAHRPRINGRVLAAVAAAVAAALLTAGAVAAPLTIRTTAEQEQGMSPGASLADPGAVSTDKMDITLDAAKTRLTVSGKEVWGQTYGGTTLAAPTLHLEPGTTSSITLHNRLRVATSLHFHGLHTSPEGSSDNPFLCIPAGASYTYHLDLPADHPQGTFWYHSHAMGTSCPAETGTGGHAHHMPSASFVPGDVENQISAGLSGELVVGDNRASLPASLRDVPVHDMVLRDAQIDKAGKIVQNTAATSIDSNADTVRLVNGQLRPVLSMRPGETQLWRLANIGADIFYRLQLGGYRFRVLAEDGNEYPAAADAAELLLPPGKRYDVLVTAAQTAGTTWLHTLAYSNGPQGDSYPDTQLMKLDVSGSAAVTTTDPLPAGTLLHGAEADLRGAVSAQSRTVVLSEDPSGNSFDINGRQFAMDRPTFDTAAKLGTVEEWTILNTSGEDHPFHMHTNAFQVMSTNGTPLSAPHRQDTVIVPHATDGTPGKVVIRQAFTDYPGRWMFHCHIAAHEDNGMMGYIQVVP